MRSWSIKEFLKDISFELHKGEILGFAGLVGAGRTEVAKCMIGATQKRWGNCCVHKGETLSNSLSRNIEKGIVYLSEDRKDEGLVLMHSVMDNIALPNLKQLAKPFIRKKEMADRAKDYIRACGLRPIHILRSKNLSGGNQQKVVIAKWLYSNADVYIFDEPTRGIDVGARDEIYNIMYDLVNQGASIIMISSDLVEVLKMCDRVAVMREGVLEAILDNSPDLTQETILKYAMQGGI
ncbi:MAG: ATP-binding cassette domain-containing protein [Enterocloster sp.]